MNTKWKSIVEISDDGRVRFVGGPEIQSRSSTRGYQNISLAVHRMVALAFCATRDGATVVNHVDGNTRNNAAKNLEWVTQSENCLHHPKKRKLSALQVSAILAMKPASLVQLRDLAAKHGIAVVTAGAIRCGRTWSGKSPSNRARLSADAVAEIRDWKKPSPTSAEVARKFKVSKTIVLSIWNGQYA